ncbi:hypothetical protein V2J09_007191 [Rumex salicifolius]
MATSRLMFRPVVSSRPLQSSCSSYARKGSPNSSRKDTCQALGSDSNINGEEMSFTRANAAGSRNTHLARKVTIQEVIPLPLIGQSFDVVGLPSTLAFKTAKWEFNPLQTQGLIERVIVDCRFFTFLAIAGSLIGSILCFVEGFAMVMKSYFRYFEAALHKMDYGSVVELLIEAIDMFLVGTALLIFGMGLYEMFVRPKVMLSASDRLGLFHLKGIPSWLKMESVSKAKTRVGHAIIMILQVGMLEKFNSVPLVTGLDLASFAGALLVSSASIFCLFKLSS